MTHLYHTPLLGGMIATWCQQDLPEAEVSPFLDVADCPVCLAVYQATLDAMPLITRHRQEPLLPFEDE